ncbi:DNA endonuclease SmrA [Halomonas sp. 18H]|uniref:DNA endonuclease SmrA n=1 Tax=Halomonas almeriensis TaxID=308163 RepID=UPI002230CBEE|nr:MULTISPECIES: DNA endonuclease SmrA [Halomonas]MCW4151883.1 DNA endonuclease SmrA [Halomonas sp. 18H]MDN3554129.1 DNA endonuclease SmrA [Halomonas almeriensis]
MNASKQENLDFRALMEDVEPLRSGRDRADPGRPPSSPSEAQLARRQSAEAETSTAWGLSDDFVDLIPPHDPLEWRRDGIQHGVVDRLRHGGYPAQASLHLLRRPLDECRRALPIFVCEARDSDLRSVLIVHGRGREIDSAANVLRSYLAKWLSALEEVQAYTSAAQADGGIGATWVMLRKSERARAANRERQQKRRG